MPMGKTITNDNKIFVLDTNVILYDHKSVYNFDEHNVVIPITVLEEIDDFKKGNETINFSAREFGRSLDSIASDSLFTNGVKLENGGMIFVFTGIEISHEIREVFSKDKPDHRIIAAAYNLQKEYGADRVTLVSKDINMRMKAKSIGIRSENYETGIIKDIEELYLGRRILENVETEKVDKLYSEEGKISASEIEPENAPNPNEFFILRNEHKSALARYSTFEDEAVFLRVEKTPCYGITPRNAEQTFALNALLDDRIKLVTLSGKAGTGKTLMALAAALEKRRDYRQIFLARPIVPLSNRDLGYLPGDVKSKLDPFMQPLFDNLSVIKHQFDENSPEYKKLIDMEEKEKLLITPLAYIRGRSLSKIFFIIDEAQNLTPHEVKTIITRAGDGTKIILTGDPYQIDTPYLDSHSNGLTTLIDKMKGQGLYAHVTLEKGERSELSELASDLL